MMYLFIVICLVYLSGELAHNAPQLCELREIEVFGFAFCCLSFACCRFHYLFNPHFASYSLADVFLYFNLDSYWWIYHFGAVRYFSFNSSYSEISSVASPFRSNRPLLQPRGSQMQAPFPMPLGRLNIISCTSRL